MKCVILNSVAVAGVVALSACSEVSSTPHGNTQATAVTATVAKASRAISQGMTGDDVLRRIGKPNEINTIETPEGSGEVWVYHRTAGRTTNETVTSMHDVPAFSRVNGITSMTSTHVNDLSAFKSTSMQHGAVPMIQEPTYSQEIVELEETISFLMFNGKCVGWKRVVEKKRNFS